MKLVLIGYMGSGKSTIGKKLAVDLKMQFIDLDDYIVSKEHKTIPEIFDEKGEIYFRKKETEYLNSLLLNNTNFVLSIGGGTPCYGANIKLIKRNTVSFYLRSNINTLYDRLISEKSNRPLIATISDDNLKEFIAKHLFERAPFYEQASFTIQNDVENTKEIVAEIKSKLI